VRRPVARKVTAAGTASIWEAGRAAVFREGPGFVVAWLLIRGRPAGQDREGKGMGGKACRRLPPVACIAALFAAGAIVGDCRAAQYVYSDDFSTDQAMIDSYEHSEFVEGLPDPWPLDGFLRYQSYSRDRMLTFHYGSACDSYAWLKYELPLAGSAGGVGFYSAVVELEIVNDWEGGFIQCGCSFLDAPPYAWPGASGAGMHRFEFTGSQSLDTVCVGFRGCDVSIDDLVITLEPMTPVERASWARIKCLFGDPPD
jgi:hypothetical protein